MGLFSVSVDLDEIACYSAIHGVAAAPECHAVYDLALARIREFFASQDMQITLFVVARDLDRRQNLTMLRRVVSDGHEIGNHSLDHLYDLTRREALEQTHQVVEASNRIEALLGVRPEGFRAPGYTMTDRLMAVLSGAGLRYDSSVFPCPTYYAAKAMALFGTKLLQRQSKSVLDSPNMLRAPTKPYRTGHPYWSSGAGLLEVPIQVVGPLRLPYIGTSLTLLGSSGARFLTARLLGALFVNLELHGIDFLEARDAPKQLLAVQPDLRVPLASKLKTFRAALATLRAHGYAARRLDKAARIFAGNAG